MKISEMALRNGEVAGTPQTVMMGETAAANKAKLAEIDLKRLKPLETKLLECQSKDVVFVAALWLCMFKAPDAAPEYSARVNESGGRIMRALPRQTTELQLSRLSRKLSSPDEAEAVKTIYRRTAALAGFSNDAPPAPASTATTTQSQSKGTGTPQKAK